MRHGKKIHKLGRPREHRLALMSNLATALITHGRITTTEAKAKALKPMIDRLIRTAKMNSVQSRRQVAKVIRNKVVLRKLFDDIAPEMLDRTSGYSRILRLGPRRGDGAELAVIEIVAKDSEEEFPREKTGRKKAFKGTSSRAKKAATVEVVEAEESEVAQDEAVDETPVEETVDEAEARVEGEEAAEKPEEPAEEPTSDTEEAAGDETDEPEKKE